MINKLKEGYGTD